MRGCGGYHTVTGIEDVERTIFDRYDTVVHELTHQVHGVLPADDGRAIQELYRKAKERDDATDRNGYLSRYAGGSVWEYYAEGANALVSPKRDAYDPREVVRERLLAMDPDLARLVEDPPQVPRCGILHVRVVMHYEVIVRIRGARVPTDVYAVHDCPVPVPPGAPVAPRTIGFRSGELHRMWIRAGVQGTGGVMDPFVRTPGPRWTVMEAHREAVPVTMPRPTP